MISYAYNQKWWLDTGSSLTQFRISSDWAQWSGMLSWAHTDFTKLFLRAEANIFSTNVQLHFYLKSFQTYEIQLCINFVFVTLLLGPCPFSFFRGLNGLKLYLFVDMPARLQEEIVRSSISLVAKKKKAQSQGYSFYNSRALTMKEVGKPKSRGETLSRYWMCSLVSEISSASRLESRCSTLRPPTRGKTNGAFCIKYAIATDHEIPNSQHNNKNCRQYTKYSNEPEVICFAPTSPATFSSAWLIFLSSSVRRHSVESMSRPFSPLAARFSSSASVRNLPPARTFHGAIAIPKHQKKIYSDMNRNKLSGWKNHLQLGPSGELLVPRNGPWRSTILGRWQKASKHDHARID